MLSPRTETILRSIVGQYITKARPVPSQSITDDYQLRVSPATIRNEMAYLEQEGYITRPYHSAGSVPLDKGYRRYVESLGDITLPLEEQRLISHLFHQVEEDMDKWLNLASTLIAQMAHNVVIVTMPRPEACQFKQLELVSLQNRMALVVLVLSGVKVRQQLVTFEQAVSQPELTAIANKLNAAFSGLTGPQISTGETELTVAEQQIADCLVKIMKAEDEQGYEEQYVNGWHFMLSQPEFAQNQRLLALMELVEQRSLLRSIVPPDLLSGRARVIIGKENAAEAIQDYSVVIGRYGLGNEAVGTVSVIGPTRMPYAHAITAVDYLSLILSGLIAKLYGREMPGSSRTQIIDRKKIDGRRKQGESKRAGKS